MMTARAYRLPLSLFKGRPLPAAGEALWLDDDQDAAIAYERYLNACCPGCGRHEATDPDELTVSVTRCRSCEQQEYVRRDIPEGPEGYGVRLFLEPVALVQAREAAADAARAARERQVVG